MTLVTPTTLALSFPKSARLVFSSEFLRVKKEGLSYASRTMILGFLKNADASTPSPAPARTGLITSRRVGNAVVRNRVRRRLREMVRLDRPRLLPGAWLVLIARRAAVDASFAELQAEWRRLARKAGLLERRSRPDHPENPGNPDDQGDPGARQNGEN